MKPIFRIAKSATAALIEQCFSQMQLLPTVLVLLLASGFIYPIQAQTAAQAEYEIKAALVFKLLGYIEWPTGALSAPDAPFTVGVLGQDPSGKTFTVLTAILSDKVIKGRKILVKQLTSPSEIAQCHLIFISASEKERLPEILESVKQKPVLTVGETAGFAERGGHINLTAGSNTVNLEVNNNAASQSGLTISSQLLRLRLVKVVKS